MSYILDALRKSDQQRQRGAAPKLHAGQATAVAPKKPALLVYGLIAAALVGAGMVIGWLRPWQAEQAAPGKAQPVAAKPLEPVPRQAAPVPSEAPPQQEPRLQSSSPSRKAAPAPSEAPAEPEPQLQSASPPRKAAHRPAPATAKPRLRPRAEPETDDSSREAKAAVPRNTAAPPPRPERPAGATSTDAARAQPVISMAELPLSLQQELPPMTISVHAYSSKPGDSMVGINNRMLREGDEVAPGLKLEQITPEGMILGYKGYSFRRGVK
jgi:general secretion pathway protein B